jgi:rRNA maturation RNase YbeY
MMKPAGLRRHIQVINQMPESAVQSGDLALIAELVLRRVRAQQGWNVAIILVGDREITDLKRRFFNVNRTTDVIAFNISEASAGVLEGEIYLCLDTARRQAAEYGVSVDEELQRLTAHGVYHLLGQEDTRPQEKAAMTRLEDAALAELKAYQAG